MRGSRRDRAVEDVADMSEEDEDDQPIIALVVPDARHAEGDADDDGHLSASSDEEDDEDDAKEAGEPGAEGGSGGGGDDTCSRPRWWTASAKGFVWA